MDIELLRTFLELHRTRHFGRSAEALSITQAAVSSRLKTLEERLGVSLFERSTREMHLTPEGARLVRHSEKIIAAWRAARQDVAMGEAEQQLVIGGSLRLWDVMLQRWLHDLRRSWPGLAIIAEAQSPDLLTRKLIDGVLDVAIMLEPAQLDSMQIREVAKIEFVLVASSAGMNVDQALDSGYVYVDWGLSFALDHRRAFPDAPEAGTRVSLAKMALEYIHLVGGSAYLPLHMVRKDIELGALHEVEGAPRFERHAYATFPVRSARKDLIEESLRLVRSA